MVEFNENLKRRMLEVRGIVGGEQDEMIREMCLLEFSKIAVWFRENNATLQKIGDYANDFYRVEIGRVISFFDDNDYYLDKEQLDILLTAYRHLKFVWNLPLKELESFNKWIQEEPPCARNVTVATIARYSDMVTEALQKIDVSEPEQNKYRKVILVLQEAKQKGILK